MKAATRQLTQLLKLASAAGTSSPIPEQDLLIALKNFESIYQIIACGHKPQTVIRNLQDASVEIAAFIYLNSNIKPGATVLYSKSLHAEATELYNKIGAAINSYRKPLYQSTQPIKLLPVKAFSKALENLCQQLNTLFSGTEIYQVLEPHIRSACSNRNVPFHNWLWWSYFCHYANKALQAGQPDLEDILTHCGFNCTEYVSLLSKAIINKINSKNSADERFAFITEQLLQYKLIQPLSPYAYLPGLPTIKKTMLSVLKKQMQVPSPTTQAKHSISNEEDRHKMQVNLSVPQLAVFIRLLIDAGIIKNDNSTALLKNFAAAVATPKTNMISGESLRVNFYAPPSAAKDIVKDYLIKMVNQVRSY